MGYALTTSTCTRQTVLSGSVDANGYANFLSAGTGLAVNLDATPDPVIVTFAQGFNELGTVDYFEKIDADQTISSLTASTTNFLYVDRDLSTSAITYGHTTLAPDYGFARPSSPSTGQHHFNIPKMTMEVYNGSSWEVKQRVFLGEAVTDEDSVTDVITYVLRGFCSSEIFSVSINTAYTKSINTGVNTEYVDIMCLFRENSNYNWIPLDSERRESVQTWGGGYNMFNRNQAKVQFDSNSVTNKYTNPYYAYPLGSSSINITTGECIFIAKRTF
ncbi:MAG TPA: hypothetical protein P5556_00095 [Candidatus Gastranaerophilales bacterium]|nr:hypothetical protein [Candidatus Gastranaerophilales bacterium]